MKTEIIENLLIGEAIMETAVSEHRNIMHAPTEAASFLAVIERAACNPDIDVLKMEKFLEMQEHVLTKNAEIAFNRAMRNAQSEMLPVVRDAENKHTKSKYAKLETIDENIRPIYTRHGLSLSFNSQPIEGNAVRVICEVSHDGGFSKNYQLEGALDMTGVQGSTNKTSIQGLGASVSYLRRYLTTMIFNVVLKNEDDDGNSRASSDVLSYEAAVEIDLLITEAKADKKKFLEFMGVDDVRKILAKDYLKAKNALKAKMEKQAAGESNASA